MKPRYLVALMGLAACSGSLPDGGRGIAADPQAAAYVIAGVHASPGSVHFTGLPWLLNSTEGTGPMVLTTHVGTFVLPAVTSTVTGVDPEAIWHAVGYNLSERHDVIALSTANLTEFESMRQEAYASFDETCWQVADPSSGAVVGTGASFYPSGVYFQTVNADHVALPDMGLVTFAPGCEDLACGLPLGAGGAADAGTGERRVPGFVPALSPLLGFGGVTGSEGSAPAGGLRY